MEQGANITPILAIMEQQARMASDICYDTLYAAAAATAGTAIQARIQVWFRNWKADAAQKA